MRELILNADLSAWIKANMTGAPDLRRVRIFCDTTIPFDWLPGNREKYIGITLWDKIWLREPFELNCEGAYELLFHELVHVRQFQRRPVRFPIGYLLNLRFKGYRDHPAEIEARTVAAKTRLKYFPPPPPVSTAPPAPVSTAPPIELLSNPELNAPPTDEALDWCI